MTIKYLSEKELMEIPASNEVNRRIEEINKKYPILRELEEKLNYEQFANLFFLVDRLYCYQLMWYECKKDITRASVENWKVSAERFALEMRKLEKKYFPKEVIK